MMGCKKINKNFYNKKAGHVKESLIVSLVITMLITAITPLAMAGSHSTNIWVTFDPTGDIDIDVSPKTANWTSTDIPINTTDNDPDEGSGTTIYTLYNNGSIDAHVYVQTNGTSRDGSNNADWTLDPDGSWTTGTTDVFSIQFNNNTGGSQWLTTANQSWWNPLAGQTARKFGIQMDISAASGSAVMDIQYSLINITATQA